MGAYLSHPKTDKTSSDQFNELLVVGASSMQGWRNSQEDAHNSILNFDKNTSFFAVYDGHGGAEVAQYCADKLPHFLKNLETYKNGQFEVALKEAFLGFDKTLLDPSIVGILKILAGEHNFVDAEADDYEDEDLAELQEESNLPLNEVLEKYKGLPQRPDLDLKSSDHRENFKMRSPYCRGRRAAALAAEATNKAVMDPSAKPDGSSTSAAAAAAALSADGLVNSRNLSNVVNPKAEAADNTTSSINDLSTKNAALKDDSINDQNEGSNGTGSKSTLVSSSNIKLFATGSNDMPELNQSSKNEFTNSSTSKEFERNINSSQEDEFTDDDADYEENDNVKSPDTSSAESSDCTENDDDGDEDLFDNCLAPNTMGDGTGCDNMTAVIVQFKKKLQELQSTIPPNQTEDKLLKTSENVSHSLNDHSAPKRCASQNADTDDEILEKNNSKRLKTDLEPENIKGGTPSPNSQNEDPDKKAIKEVTIIVSSS
ncbi:GD10360 [Drosophila simulans]|uniref:protein-serine/threonine phosphatase n=1 Tax=Drosophila simulans TaxID=7240 RepID=B4QC37_DROSI|nr:GD10360 [Drosophila simulans]